MIPSMPLRVGLVSSLAVALALAGPSASAAVELTKVSLDPYSNTSSQHRTEVEPDTFSFGSKLVAAFQVGRFTDGGASNIGWASSSDSGASWANGFLPGTTTFAGGSYNRVSDPSVAYDAKHDAWLVASLALAGTPSVKGAAVLVNRSTDGGSSWGNPVTVASAAGSADFDKSWTVCDNTSTSPFYGNCYATWDDFGDGNRVKMSTSSDGGLTWGAAKNTADNATGLGGQPLVQPGGTVIVPLTNAFETAILAFSSADGGASWGSTVTVSPISAHLVAGDLRTSPLPSAEIDGAGKSYVVWQDCSFRASCSSNDIVMSSSADGSSWSSPSRIPVDPTTSTVDHFIPGLGVDKESSGAGGKLALTYYYYPTADCTTVTCQLDVGSTTSADGGSTWSAPVQLAGPMNVTWLPATTQGYMVGDYLSTSFVGANARTVFGSANAPSGGVFDQAMYALINPGTAAPPAQSGSSVVTGNSPVTQRPRLTGLMLAPRAFLAASRGRSIARATGSTVRYTLSQPATTRFQVERAAPGRRSGGRCVRPTHHNRHGRRCIRWVRLHGSFLHRGGGGPNLFRFTGRLRGKKLAPSRYRLVAVPRNRAGTAARAARARFSIIHARKARRRASAR